MQGEGQVGILKERELARGTHFLEGERRTHQDTGRWVSKGHSQTDKHRGRYKSGYQKKKKLPSKGHAQAGEWSGVDKSEQRPKASKQNSLTS